MPDPEMCRDTFYWGGGRFDRSAIAKKIGHGKHCGFTNVLSNFLAISKIRWRDALTFPQKHIAALICKFFIMASWFTHRLTKQTTEAALLLD